MQNEGACIDEIEGYTCVCEAGYTGQNCQHQVDFCADQPCKNGGTCTNGENSFTCSCRPGYASSPTCDIENDECAPGPCDPSGTLECLDLDNKFECICRDGYEGDLCKTNVDDCASSPCRNGGQCNDLVGDYECICPEGWVGKNCQEDEKRCDDTTCENNALCVDLFQVRHSKYIISMVLLIAKLNS